MRRTNSFTLKTSDFGDLKVEVYEVRPYDLLGMFKEIREGKDEGGPALGEYERLLPLCCNLTGEQLKKLYPSEMNELLTHFREVNRDFLAPWPSVRKVVDRLGLVEWLTSLLKDSGIMEILKKSAVLDLQKLFASSSSVDTNTLNATAGGSSISASE